MVNKNADQIKTIIGDIQKISSGFISLLKYCFLKDEIPLSLSLFYTDSSNVRAGTEYSYEVILVNNASQDIWTRLLFDIYLKHNPVHPEGHYAYYAKSVLIKARENKTIKISYNWGNYLKFIIDGTIALPDDTWRGMCSSMGPYIIQAALLNEQGTCLDKLSIVQQLS